MLAWRTERRRYLDLIRQKRETFWSARVDAERNFSRVVYGDRSTNFSVVVALRRLTST